MKELVVLKKEEVENDIFDLLKRNAIILTDESNQLNDIVIDLSKMNHIERLKLLEKYSSKINYIKHKPIVEYFHETPELRENIDLEISSNRFKNLTFNKLFKKEEENIFTNSNNSYDEYLEVNQDLSISKTPKAIGELITETDTKDKFYFSKVFLLSLFDKFENLGYDNFDIFFTKTYYKGVKTIALKAISFNQKFEAIYDISYNPPGGGITKEFFSL